MEKTLTITLDKAREIYGKSKEMDELLLANFSKEDLEKSKLPTKWEDLKEVNGYYLTDVGSIQKCVSPKIARSDFKHRFATEKQAKSALAMAQLSQLMAIYNDGWEADWNNTNETKYVIRANNNILFSDYYSTIVNFLAFKSAAVRNEFMKNFKSLIKEYFMID